jgi:spore coat protein U-like protein
MRLVLALLLALPTLLAVTPEAAAQSCTANVPLLDFGNLTTPLPAAGVARTVSIHCDGAASETLRLCVAIEPASGTRLLQGPGGATVAYEIYADPGHSQVWNALSTQEALVQLDAAGEADIDLTLHALLAGGASPASGLYQSAETVSGLVKPGNSPCHSGGSKGTIAPLPFGARMMVNGACEITAAPLLDFGAVGGGTTPQLDGALQLTARCTDGLPYTVGLSAGQVAGNTIADRRLGLDGTGPGLIAYQLYLDSARSQVWGDGATGAVHGDTGTGTDQAITVYGRVPAGQPLPPGGTYRDTVTATIVY